MQVSEKKSFKYGSSALFAEEMTLKSRALIESGRSLITFEK